MMNSEGEINIICTFIVNKLLTTFISHFLLHFPVKAYIRKAIALEGLNDYIGAEQVYMKAYSLGKTSEFANQIYISLSLISPLAQMQQKHREALREHI